MPPAYLRDPALRAAYLGYFLPANLPKLFLPLAELSLHPARPLAVPRLRVLDIGSGPGTSLLAVMEFFWRLPNAPALELTAVDQVAANLEDAGALIREEAGRYGAGAVLRTVHADAGSAAGRLTGRYDLVILSNVLNELFMAEEERVEKRSVFLSGLLGSVLAPGGSCMIIEPALRETSRDLLQVRDRMLTAGWSVFSPCLVQAPCPALMNPKDWCHEDRPWDAPEQVRKIDRRTGLRKDSLKFSYLVLRKDGIALCDAIGADAWRVVSEPLVSKGKTELYLCGREGRMIAVRLDKDAVPANAFFADLRRGDTVRFDRLVNEGKRLRVMKDTVVILFPDHRAAGGIIP